MQRPAGTLTPLIPARPNRYFLDESIRSRRDGPDGLMLWASAELRDRLAARAHLTRRLNAYRRITCTAIHRAHRETSSQGAHPASEPVAQRQAETMAPQLRPRRGELERQRLPSRQTTRPLPCPVSTGPRSV